MDPKKLEMIEEILEHLSGHQAKSLKDLLDKSRMPKEMPMEEGKEGDEMPKEMGIEVDVIKPKEEGELDEESPPEMDKKPGDEKMGGESEEMTDDELMELISKLTC